MLSPLESWTLILGLAFFVAVGSVAAWWLLSRPPVDEPSDLAAALAELGRLPEPYDWQIHGK